MNISLKQYNKASILLENIGVTEHYLNPEQLMAIVEDIALGFDLPSVRETIELAITEDVDDFVTAVKSQFNENDFSYEVSESEYNEEVNESSRARAPKLRGIKKKMAQNKAKVSAAAKRDDKVKRVIDQAKAKITRLMKQIAKREGVPVNRIDLSKIKL